MVLMKDRKRQALSGIPFRLSAQVQYQDGSIASKMIIFGKCGNITVFAFDEGEGLPEHTAPYEAVVTVLEGVCRVTVGGTVTRLIEGETIIFPPDVPHAVFAETRFKMSLTMIRGDSLPESDD
jgi:quercetin dioxygenase-like cupin family protein